MNESIKNNSVLKIGGSLAVRIPKEIADIIGLKEGSDVKVAVKEKKIVIEAA
ncbi:MAG: AbrB/MazE/SpoVT family DNA-binding domain-containing protein [Methanosarcinales archaeon]|nr:MAG: AbrB/MazE/SpoVT family DNA-binding domain-containing protein [Methanosarcinales archaeon]